jgi:hypothetical protein
MQTKASSLNLGDSLFISLLVLNDGFGLDG